MSGNINVSFGGETPYSQIAPKVYASADGSLNGNNIEFLPNIFYEFGSLDFLTLVEKGRADKVFQMYMFEFTAKKDGVTLKILSEKEVYWPVVPEFIAGHRYQVSALNGIYLFVEVSE